jgi:ABC-type nitrate/sulfonate/bicarbonate transport system substrate-binding protein
MRFAERTIENRRKRETSRMSGRQCAPARRDQPDCIWITRCPVPAASGVAWALGWMTEAFGRDGIGVEARPRGRAQPRLASDPERQARYLFREGGNIQALAARAGAPTRVIGLTWIDERQAIMVRPDTRIMEPADLKGLRFALPGFARTRGESIARGMALHGIKGALTLGGLDLDDVRLVDVPAPRSSNPPRRACGGCGWGSNGWPKGASMRSM